MINQMTDEKIRQHYDASHKMKTRRIGHYCRLCGKAEKGKWNAETDQRIIKNGTCYHCDLWLRTIAQDQINPIWYAKMIISGARYTVKPLKEHELEALKGNKDRSKQVFIVENIKTGERKAFSNMKISAVIPKHFLSEFPDNARLITDDPEYPLLESDCNCH